MATFKEYLAELMVDVDSNLDANDQLLNVRKQQMMAKKSPERVTRAQIQQAKQEKQAAAQSTDPSAALQRQIAQKKEELFRLQQKLQAMTKKNQAAVLPGMPQ